VSIGVQWAAAPSGYNGASRFYREQAWANSSTQARENRSDKNRSVSSFGVPNHPRSKPQGVAFWRLKTKITDINGDPHLSHDLWSPPPIAKRPTTGHKHVNPSTHEIACWLL